MTNPGRILGGRYRLIEPLGKGGMGTVWRAEHVALGSPLAVKLIDEDLAESAVVRARFRQEAKAAAALGGDHVVKTFDYGVEGDTPYIVMELLIGESLQDRLKRTRTLPPAEVQALLSQVALALDRAHEQGMVHRDLKPGNLFLTRGDDGHERVKLLDFGTAKLLRKEGDSDASQTRTGAMVGSPAYMSPEQLRGLRDIDPTTDLWALGVVAYECLIGQRPFLAPTIADLTVRICSDSLPIPSTAGSVPAGFDDWFAKACAHEPLRRFQRAGDLAHAFEALLTGPSATGPAPNPFEVTVELPQPPMAPSPREGSPSPQADSTGGVAHSQTVSPAIARRSSLPWLVGLGAVVIGALGLVVVRASGTLGEAGTARPSPTVRPDAGTVAGYAAVVPDAGAPNDARTPATDTLGPTPTGPRKAPARAGKPPRGGAKAVDESPPPPARQTDKVYGF